MIMWNMVSNHWHLLFLHNPWQSKAVSWGNGWHPISADSLVGFQGAEFSPASSGALPTSPPNALAKWRLEAEPAEPRYGTNQPLIGCNWYSIISIAMYCSYITSHVTWPHFETVSHIWFRLLEGEFEDVERLSLAMTGLDIHILKGDVSWCVHWAKHVTFKWSW